MISYLRKAIRVRRKYSGIPGLGIRIIQGDVLSHSQIQDILLFICRSTRIIPNVLAGNHMLDDAKGSR